jgi:hypothetical protein
MNLLFLYRIKSYIKGSFLMGARERFLLGKRGICGLNLPSPGGSNQESFKGESLIGKKGKFLEWSE